MEASAEALLLPERRPSAGEAQTESRPRVPGPERPANAAYKQPEVQPELKNTERVQRVLMRSYPPLLRDAGIGGTTWILLLVNEEGRVTKLQITKGSGHAPLDEAAMSVAEIMQFTPGRNGNKTVAAWIEVPILFTTK